MAGFFKKLFNRIVGKKDEAPGADVPAALPAPEPEHLPEESSVEDAAPEPVVARGAERIPPPAIKQPVPSKTKVKAPAAKPPVAKVAKAKPPEPVKRPAKQTVKQPVKSVVEKKKPASKKDDLPAAAAKKAATKTPDTLVRKVTAKPSAPKVEKTARVAVAPPAEVSRPPVVPTPVVVRPPREPSPITTVAPLPEPLTPRSKPFVKPVPQPLPVPQPVAEKSGWLSRLKTGLSKSSKSLTGSITAIFTKRKLDATTLQDLEDTLIQADLGIAVAERIIKAVATGRYEKEIDPEEVKQILASEVGKVLKPVEVPFNFGTEKPYVILVVGVNGSGKTTTIGKLGAIATGEGYKVKFAACDTFRAAAIEQLTVWGQRIGAETISRPQGADAAGLAFDAMKASAADGTDILFIDTAGRLHNKAYLMDELDKVVRVIKKYDVAAPHAVLLVLDATTGQNALAQAEAFTQVAGVTGLIMTKLDGTARGGILVAIAERFKLPIHAVGVGETVDDLQPFDADAFARAIAGLDD